MGKSSTASRLLSVAWIFGRLDGLNWFLKGSASVFVPSVLPVPAEQSELSILFFPAHEFPMHINKRETLTLTFKPRNSSFFDVVAGRPPSSLFVCPYQHREEGEDAA